MSKIFAITLQSGRKYVSQYVRRSEGVTALAFLAPSFAGILIFFLIPFADTVRRSFYDVRGVNFIGLQSYTSVINNAAFRLAATNTLRFVAICIPLLLLISLGIALLIRCIRPHNALFKTTFLLPMAVPVASIVLLWQVVFNDNGLANSVLEFFNLNAVNFMGSGAAFWVLVFTYLWKNTGYNMILWLAGLDSISDTLYEAAHVDGANKWQSFRYVTLPCLLPTIGIVSILSLLNSFKVFREAYLVAGAYPHDSMYLLQHLFNNWFVQMDVSRLSAAATMLAVVLLVIILLIRGFLDEKD
ncbi:MAG: sugar ABC transporter permease [Defluviitaleaceae bacterium]|nr:sugar ABC transporter permease [Defluviitaleaceae bacterium]MCL2274502.1 sugar ABC transporter permease [Defluviitaleaceae bacterium]